MPSKPAARSSRKSSPAVSASRESVVDKARGRQSRSKSSSPTAVKTSKATAAVAAKKSQAPAAKPRSRSSSRSRKPQQETAATPEAKQATKAPRQPTPKPATAAADAAAAAAPRPRRAAARNHSGSVTPAGATGASHHSSPELSTHNRQHTAASSSTASLATSSSSSHIQQRQASGAPAREFGGACGAVLMTLGLPLALIVLSLVSDGNATIGRQNKWLFALENQFQLKDLFSLRAALIYAGWLAAQLLLYCLPVGGKWIQQEGRWYHCNGLFALVVSLTGFALASWRGVPVALILCQELTRITVCACIFSALVSVALFARSCNLPVGALTAEAAGTVAASGGCCRGCGTAVYEFFMGRELHPRLAGGLVDLKFFLEMRPGLIGWAVIDLAFVIQAITNQAGLGTPLAHLAFMHIWYVADALLFEKSILTTTDIKREGLGFMLAFGNLAWVPFFYSLSARQLIKYAPVIPIYCQVGIALVNVFGYWLFRFSNLQKDKYRSDPHQPRFVGARTIPTGVRGHNLLADGFWGCLRHPNFTGDLVMATAWSLAAGCHAPLAWLYPPYLLGLLVHRAIRDEAHCSNKYGIAWQRYCDLVPWRLVPKIY